MYLVAFAVIAALTIGSQILIHGLTSGLQGDGAVINVAGRQRMLSQRVASEAQQITSAVRHGDVERARSLCDEFASTLELWIKSDTALRAQDLTTGLKVVNSPRTEDLFLASRPYFQAANDDAQSLIATVRGADPSINLAEAMTRAIVKNTGSFLPIMHEIVGQYETESAARVKQLRFAEHALGALLLIVLIAQVFVIFEPMVRKLRAQHRALTARTEELRAHAEIAEKTTNAVILTDARGGITWVNAGFTRVTGYTADEALGKKPGSLLQGEQTDQAAVARIREAVKGGRAIRTELLNRTKDGRDYWIDINIQPRHDENGALIGFMAIESDITQIVLARRHIQTLFDNAADAMVELNAEGTIVGCNPATERIFGLTTDQIKGRTPHDPRWMSVREDGTNFPGEEHPASVTLRTGRPIRSFVHGISHANGNRRWISVSTQVVRDAGSRVTGVIASVADVTEQREDARRLEMIISGAKLGTWDWSVKTGDVRFNLQWAAMLGYQLDEIEPHLRSWERLVHPDDMPLAKSALADHFEGRSATYSCEHRLLRKDGTWAWVLTTGQISERDVDGNPLRASGIHLDITEAKSFEHALQATKSAANAANAAKSEFLANMSHEIRTPMTAIIGYADLLEEMAQDQFDPQVGREYAETIRRNGQHLITIINDILDISKIEAGKIDIELISVDAEQMLFEVDSLMRVRSKAKAVNLEIIRETPLPRTIQTDPTRLRQILVNLIGNAIKFTEIGGVTVRVGLDTTVAEKPKLRIDVQDTGIGMTQEQIDKLFQAFVQADSSMTRRFGGSGLGLRISHELCQLLGGSISVSSSPGEGSTFTIIIPVGSLEGVEIVDSIGYSRAVQESHRPTPSATKCQTLTGMRIFFAEDGPDNQRLIGFHLRKAGAAVTVYDNGLRCLEAMTVDGTRDGALLDEPPCDLVLTDMQMPEMDGYTLARTLRQKGWKGRIVALTAHAMTSDIQRCIDAGCDEYASKPIDRADLIAVCDPTGRTHPHDAAA
jgi:PAS domain S-box-containing protein